MNKFLFCCLQTISVWLQLENKRTLNPQFSCRLKPTVTPDVPLYVAAFISPSTFTRLQGLQPGRIPTA